MTIYKHYNQEQLNDQYNNRSQVPDHADYFKRWERLSRQTEQEYPIEKNIFFGSHPQECLDIFPSTIPLAKTMIFIHGGYWHLLDKALFYFITATFLKQNVTTVFVNYPLAPAASINTIVMSCRNAMRWLHDNIVRFNGNPLQMYVMGHSAGGHLACMMSVEEEMDFLRGMISLSGLFRLEPLMLSNLNDILGLDTETATRNSPVLLEPRNFCPLLLAAGTNETDEFKDQTMEMYSGWENKHSSLNLLQVKGKNHYSILDAVTERNSPLQSVIFRLMNI